MRVTARVVLSDWPTSNWRGYACDRLGAASPLLKCKPSYESGLLSDTRRIFGRLVQHATIFEMNVELSPPRRPRTKTRPRRATGPRDGQDRDLIVAPRQLKRPAPSSHPDRRAAKCGTLVD